MSWTLCRRLDFENTSSEGFKERKNMFSETRGRGKSMSCSGRKISVILKNIFIYLFLERRERREKERERKMTWEKNIDWLWELNLWALAMPKQLSHRGQGSLVNFTCSYVWRKHVNNKIGYLNKDIFKQSIKYTDCSCSL